MPGADSKPLQFVQNYLSPLKIYRLPLYEIDYSNIKLKTITV